MNIEWKTSIEPVDYEMAVKEMEERVDLIINKKTPELIWFLEHSSIYTAGSSADEKELLRKDIPVYHSGRGGKYTYHGPGQLIIYILLDLKQRALPNGPDIRKFIQNIEDWLIKSFADVGILAIKRQDRIGIWTFNQAGQEVKIAAVGIRVRKWVTYHGVAINFSPDLDFYDGIIPCGIKEFAVSSLDKLGYKTTYKEFELILQRNFSAFF